MRTIIYNDIIIGYIGYYNGKYLNKLLVNKYHLRILIDINYRRKGFAFEILTEFINIMFSKNINKIYSLIEENNTSSINLHKKLNFVHNDNIYIKNKKYTQFTISKN